MDSKLQHPTNDYDVVVIGAGIAGINAAYRIQTQLPKYRYTVLEARGSIGGTWDLFRYPGIRSDSDLHTFGFPWRPWTKQNPIADAESILSYMNETVSICGIDRHIQFHHMLAAADWSSKRQSWMLTVHEGEQTKYYHTRFLFLGTGYYDYHKPLSTVIPGIENFKGEVIHPQFWPKDVDYSNKKMVVIGSGATAITLLPNLAKKASHVTMLQRSPSYFISIPNSERRPWTDRWLPRWLSCKINRYKFLIFTHIFYHYCLMFPNAAKKWMRSNTIKMLPSAVPYSPHFEPRYNPWEQRLCICPDGDFFKSLHDGKADIVTSHIKTVSETGIELESGNKLDTDIIVTATGLKLQFGGGARISVDGIPLRLPDKFTWNAVMLQDVPNCFLVFGYANASWTLAADTAATLVCRLLQQMNREGLASAVPKIDHPEEIKLSTTLTLTSTYVLKALGSFPKSGVSGPWKSRSNYFMDYYKAKYGDISTGLQFSKF